MKLSKNLDAEFVLLVIIAAGIVLALIDFGQNLSADSNRPTAARQR